MINKDNLTEKLINWMIKVRQEDLRGIGRFNKKQKLVLQQEINELNSLLGVKTPLVSDGSTLIPLLPKDKNNIIDNIQSLIRDYNYGNITIMDLVTKIEELRK